MTPAVRMIIETSGFSTTEADGSETSGPIYAVAFRISGTGAQVELSGVKVMDPATGFEIAVDTFQTPVRDPSDSTMLIIDRSGVPLSPSPKQITGELRIGEGSDLQVIPFSGTLLYEYREERRNRFWDAINSA